MTPCSKSAASRAILTAAALGFGLLAAPALAHHSFAMFDSAHPGSINGIVKELNWTNPHISLLVYRDGKTGGAAEVWTFEGAGPATLTRAGWSKRSMQPGDKVLVNYLPLRGGGNSGEIKSIVLPSGKVLGNGAS
jgi:hypothetical protein